MVDVGDKPLTQREAVASGEVWMAVATADLIRGDGVKKGNVLEVARLAGIMAAKKTGELIPLCHPLAISAANVEFEWVDLATNQEGKAASATLKITARVKIAAQTGVEMEALTAVSVAALTVYDMCKSADKGMVIQRIQLEEKRGGQSGEFLRQADSPPPA